jgi:hypothetical protein
VGKLSAVFRDPNAKQASEPVKSQMQLDRNSR